MKLYSIRAIYRHEAARLLRVFGQSAAASILTTALYILVLRQMVGNSVPDFDGIGLLAFIIPGLIVVTVVTQSVAAASFRT